MPEPASVKKERCSARSLLSNLGKQNCEICQFWEAYRDLVFVGNCRSKYLDCWAGIDVSLDINHGQRVFIE